MAYRHVDESKKGDDYVIGHKRLQIDEAKAGFMGICGLLSAVFIWQVFNELSKMKGAPELLSLIGFGIAILWALFVVVESSLIYYSETPCFGKTSVKLVYWVFFMSAVMSGVVESRSGFGYGKLYGVIEVLVVFLILYILLKLTKKAIRKIRLSRRAARG